MFLLVRCYCSWIPITAVFQFDEVEGEIKSTVMSNYKLN
jgi:hypothetical protein